MSFNSGRFSPAASASPPRSVSLVLYNITVALVSLDRTLTDCASASAVPSPTAVS
eukprot:CAMPEP_0204455172 /NCGR_PEP_ID=MMETSP0471-20130131/854_2 /ASSEMBLY_ACC=CAM_ASM_000602 /TAXON_ID=2969 /ORGANISM="Oxyrrhis marina" /LENGTH=54 /DNA_ID=CAMNT_0051455153 /DNA_START=162 /DNA_END=322 /DNA_ORIENTATION=-